MSGFSDLGTTSCSSSSFGRGRAIQDHSGIRHKGIGDPRNPSVDIEGAEDDDFDAALLPEISFEPTISKDNTGSTLDQESQDIAMNSRIPGEAERHDETEWLPVTKLN
ncbi:hypothetical protein PI124_g8052 [Phytophthora idaei]|nr:hypothetical protein PI125_g9517 [Phytophthora idaei]KAG3147916.1 hypothetical protein PI126_g12676 [Phytophthora idaei]KAG3247259.1 hypothetical protein PI124_g8052 [Phytophthora idaei]